MLGIGTIAKKVFGTPNDRRIKAIRPLVEQINVLEPEFEKLSDDEWGNINGLVKKAEEAFIELRDDDFKELLEEIGDSAHITMTPEVARGGVGTVCAPSVALHVCGRDGGDRPVLLLRVLLAHGLSSNTHGLVQNY